MDRQCEQLLLSVIPSFNYKKYKNKTLFYFLRLSNIHQIKCTSHEKQLIILYPIQKNMTTEQWESIYYRTKHIYGCPMQHVANFLKMGLPSTRKTTWLPHVSMQNAPPISSPSFKSLNACLMIPEAVGYNLSVSFNTIPICTGMPNLVS